MRCIPNQRYGPGLHDKCKMHGCHSTRQKRKKDGWYTVGFHNQMWEDWHMLRCRISLYVDLKSKITMTWHPYRN